MERESVGWDASAQAWIDTVEADPNRSLVLDPAMLGQAGDVRGLSVIDIGCGEGRFCRMLAARGAKTVGIDPTRRFVEQAKTLDPEGDYRVAGAEALPFEDATFDMAVSYLVLIDVKDFRTAVREMARVLKPGGRALVAILHPMVSTMERPWFLDEEGNKQFLRVDRYNDEKSEVVSWSGITVVGYHRPLNMYMNAHLDAGLALERFVEPLPDPQTAQDEPRVVDYLRVPFMNLTVWSKK